MPPFLIARHNHFCWKKNIHQHQINLLCFVFYNSPHFTSWGHTQQTHNHRTPITNCIHLPHSPSDSSVWLIRYIHDHIIVTEFSLFYLIFDRQTQPQVYLMLTVPLGKRCCCFFFWLFIAALKQGIELLLQAYGLCLEWQFFLK
jgi:hypothetical protein